MNSLLQTTVNIQFLYLLLVQRVLPQQRRPLVYLGLPLAGVHDDDDADDDDAVDDDIDVIRADTDNGGEESTCTQIFQLCRPPNLL